MFNFIRFDRIKPTKLGKCIDPFLYFLLLSKFYVYTILLGLGKYYRSFDL
jgi:hypothetical protein